MSTEYLYHPPTHPSPHANDEGTRHRAPRALSARVARVHTQARRASSLSALLTRGGAPRRAARGGRDARGALARLARVSVAANRRVLKASCTCIVLGRSSFEKNS